MKEYSLDQIQSNDYIEQLWVYFYILKDELKIRPYVKEVTLKGKKERKRERKPKIH
jgi:hypothetical protein